MKYRNLFFIIVISAITFLAACGTADQEGQGNLDETEPTNAEAEVVEDVTKHLTTTVDILQNEQVVLFDTILENTSSEDITLTFNSGQQFEIIVTNNKDEEVYRYSKDKAFTEAIEDVILAAGETLEWHDEWVVNEDLPSGDYKAVVQVVASELNDKQVEKGSELAATKDFKIDMNNSAFRNIESSGSNGEYVVTGEARVFEGTFIYTVEEGHDYLIDETVVQVNEGAPAWAPFEIEISIPEDQLPVNGTLTLNLFERSANDNSIVNQYFVKLDEFGY